jgi:hypothetical protein
MTGVPDAFDDCARVYRSDNHRIGNPANPLIKVGRAIGSRLRANGVLGPHCPFGKQSRRLHGQRSGSDSVWAPCQLLVPCGCCGCDGRAFASRKLKTNSVAPTLRASSAKMGCPLSGSLLGCGHSGGATFRSDNGLTQPRAAEVAHSQCRRTARVALANTLKDGILRLPHRHLPGDW